MTEKFEDAEITITIGKRVYILNANDLETIREFIDQFKAGEFDGFDLRDCIFVDEGWEDFEEEETEAVKPTHYSYTVH